MKHLLDIKNFLSEALTPYYQNKYKTFGWGRSQETRMYLNKLLDNQERVYIPYNSDTISKTQLKVKSYLEENGYVIHDYKQNLAYQKENPKRQLRISKLLVKNPELLKEFTLDDTRANIRAGSEFSIVLTSNYEDVAGMSFQRCWDNSCLDIKNGENKRYIQEEVKQGTIVAYLIESDDLNIEDPLGRVNIKPYYSLRDENEILYVLDRRVYGNVPDEDLFLSIITQYLKEKQEVKLVGFYYKVEGLYSDPGSPHFVSIGKDYKVCYDCVRDEEGYDRFGYDEDGYDDWGFNREGFGKDGFDSKGLDRQGYDKEGYNKQGYDKEGFDRKGFDRYGIPKTGEYPFQEHLTREQYIFLKKSVSRTFDVDKEGLVNVDGDVNIYNQGLTEIPVKFGVVKGGFYCHHNNLTSLEGAPRVVSGWLGEFACAFNNLTSLEGAPQEVSKGFYCANQKNGHRFTKEDVLKVSKVGGDIEV